MGLTSWGSTRCIAGAENLKQVDDLCMKRRAVEAHPSLWTTLWSLCENALWRIIASQLWNSAVISCRFTAPCCTRLSWRICCSENCVPGGCQSNWHQNTNRGHGVSIVISAVVQNGNEFLNWIITGDETWVAHITPETKQQSMHWHHSGSPCKMKFAHTLSAQKVMCTVFWNRQGILLNDFLSIDETVNAECYCKTLQKLWRAIQNKRCRRLSASVVLLNDNARLHTARQSIHLLLEFTWEVLNHACPVSVNIFRMTKKQRWVSHSGYNPRRQTSKTQGTKVSPTVWQMCQFRRLICWKIAQHLLYLFQ